MFTFVKYGTLFSFLFSALLLITVLSREESEFIDRTETSASTDLTEQEIGHFINLVTRNEESVATQAIIYIDNNWKPGYEVMLLESIYFSLNGKHSAKLIHLLERKTGKAYGADLDKWFEWLWNRPATFSPAYFEFKAQLHQLIDPRFYKYFSERHSTARIRLDEVRWGGVLQDGIPPLRNPKMIAADGAYYLNDDDVVFGIEVNGDARAYPKRILAWHEMFVDTVGDTPVAGVYCTLCGTVILYKTDHKGVRHSMGTSGFLYRSNKLMYDKETQSLWSTLEGEPVIGPLAGKGIQLDYLSVVTTTWGEWKKRQPKTTVLSLDTGHRRDYSEGAAYRDYFATDELMFGVPKTDNSLKNKAEILAIRLQNKTSENLAISSRFLAKNPIYHSRLGNTNFTVFTDRTGAHRVFDTAALEFKTYDGRSKAQDTQGGKWILSENELVSESGQSLKRIPTFNAFWFGYKAAFPDVQLIK
ncbi:DUF3179 domain-containing protein [Poritiphilus flavus]|uniref:DUF3179 domain-containing protein n=1 Tax=Poritiphilus flavus TaxID=2697053 RepID=A0A6L9EEB3_9FLAO|nr:DUF3179 domain-containing protein [Poritiphilus flavus]NAS13056.1 DUF3179 domain-containing protein [Poritiphilus flavus]